MDFLHVVILSFISSAVFFLFQFTRGRGESTDDDHQILPPIFHTDPYEECVQEQNMFCRASFKLTPTNRTDPSEVWKLIEETKSSNELYNHDELFHAICVSKNFNRENQTIMNKDISNLYADTYSKKGLDIKLIDIDCDEIEYHPQIFDYVFLSIVIIYLLMIFSATLYDIRMKKGKNDILVFSLRHNLIMLRKTYHQMPFGNLRCIQAMRFYASVSIIGTHTYMSLVGGYVEDTKYIEDMQQNVFKRSGINLILLLVQTFFLISSWLLSYHTFKTFQKNSKINPWKYVLSTFCNRYLRLIPPVLFVVCLDRSAWAHKWVTGPVNKAFGVEEYQRCEKNWWATLLLISNHYCSYEMCAQWMWYLCADTQLYAVSLVVLTIIIKLKHAKFLIMSIFLLVGIMTFSTVSYIHNLGVMYNLVPDTFKNLKFLYTTEFYASYTSTYSNMATYFLGLIFGYIYFCSENQKVFDNKLKVTVLWIFALSSPLVALVVPFYQQQLTEIISAVLAGIIKPLYALGIGFLLFGMSHQIGGVFQRIFECKAVTFLGNFAYSTYVVHVLVVSYRTTTSLRPLEVSDSILVTSFVQDVVLSYICGFLMYLLIEMPLSQLQQILVPKYRVPK